MKTGTCFAHSYFITHLLVEGFTLQENVRLGNPGTMPLFLTTFVAEAEQCLLETTIGTTEQLQ